MSESTHAVILNPLETAALATYLAMRKIADADDWLLWEDVPLLDEEGHRQLLDTLTDLANEMRQQIAQQERLYDFDAQEIYGRVS